MIFVLRAVHRLREPFLKVSHSSCLVLLCMYVMWYGKPRESVGLLLRTGRALASIVVVAQPVSCSVSAVRRT